MSDCCDEIVILEESESALIIDEENNTLVVEEDSAALVLVEDGQNDSITINEGSVIVVAGSNTVIDASSVSVAPTTQHPHLTLQDVLDNVGVYRFVHTQTAAASTWNITHNLGYLPSYSLINLVGDGVNACVNVTSLTATVTSDIPFTGHLILR